MNFDYTYITVLGYQIFEPLVFVSNSILFSVTLFSYLRLKVLAHDYAKHMALFFVFVGTSSLFGAVCHMVHYNLGETFFDIFFFIMNALNLLSIYYCFRAAHFFVVEKRPRAQKIVNFVTAWIVILLVYSLINNSFLLIKLHAGLVLLYSLIVHFIAARDRTETGSRVVVTGILISFTSFIIHSKKISFHEWFNYKDISHVIIIISLIIIYKGAIANAKEIVSHSNAEA